jgi:3-hydroxyacyl-CoA dehydrogenase/enoyl-CoA hydratase/3-hydroxybutyryl-CoA epimerase
MTETEREHHMAFKNFKVETDADGIALVTWDIPGRSMNVLDETSVNELEEIVKQTTADAAIKGVVITSSKEAFCAGADLSMLEGMSHTYAELLKQKGEVAANQTLFDQSRRFSQVFRNIETSGKPWAAAINGLALPRRASACRKSRSACSRAPAAPSACRASSRRRMRCNCC